MGILTWDFVIDASLILTIMFYAIYKSINSIISMNFGNQYKSPRSNIKRRTIDVLVLIWIVSLVIASIAK